MYGSKYGRRTYHGDDTGEGESSRPPHQVATNDKSGHLEEAMDEYGTAILAMTDEELRMFGILDWTLE